MNRKNEVEDDYYKHIPIKIILEAVLSNESAFEYILKRYHSYIAKLASYRVEDRNGRHLTILDEDKKQQIEEALILAIRCFEIKI